MRAFRLLAIALLLFAVAAHAQEELTGLRGDPEAIAEAEAMVESMGGMEIWSKLTSVHFQHRWYPYNRTDSYFEDEILDLTGPRSWVRMKSEVFERLRAYSPEYGYWSVMNGEFSKGSEESLANAMERAPFSIYRIARAVAVGDPFYEVRFGEGEIPRSRSLDFYGPDGKKRGWIILNASKEPILWATTQYKYIFGPMEQYGNLRVPRWAMYGNFGIFYEMVDLVGDSKPLDIDLFAVPDEYQQ